MVRLEVFFLDEFRDLFPNLRILCPQTITPPLVLGLLLHPNSQDECKCAFQLIDSNIFISGNITTSELGEVMRDLRQNPTDTEIQDIINEGDTDRDGAMDFPGKRLLPIYLFISS